MNRLKQKMQKRKGFTLVELIVVIVIILILAAVMVPLLMNYIGQAKTAKNMQEAKTCMTVAQAELANAYANNVILTKLPGVQQNSGSGTKAADTDLSNTDIGKAIRESVGNPYMLAIGAGDYNTHKRQNRLDKAYTVYFVIYWANKDDDPIIYDGVDWSTRNPWGKTTRHKNWKSNIYTLASGENIQLQFYFISAPQDMKATISNWKLLQDKLDSIN